MEPVRSLSPVSEDLLDLADTGSHEGIVFNLLEEAVERDHGEDTWDAILTRAASRVSTRRSATTPTRTLALVSAASEALADTGRRRRPWFGRNALLLFAERYPRFFEPHARTRSFVLTLNDIIHPEVRKLYPGADVPDFDFDPATPSASDGLPVDAPAVRVGGGRSSAPRDHYRRALAIEQPSCMQRGDERCLFEIAFSASAARRDAPNARAAAARERRARHEAESIAERMTRELYDKQQEWCCSRRVAAANEARPWKRRSGARRRGLRTHQLAGRTTPTARPCSGAGADAIWHLEPPRYEAFRA